MMKAQPEWTTFEKKYQIESQMGKGAHGVVYKVFEKRPKTSETALKYYAAKKLF